MKACGKTKTHKTTEARGQMKACGKAKTQRTTETRGKVKARGKMKERGKTKIHGTTEARAKTKVRGKMKGCATDSGNPLGRPGEEGSVVELDNRKRFQCLHRVIVRTRKDDSTRGIDENTWEENIVREDQGGKMKLRWIVETHETMKRHDPEIKEHRKCVQCRSRELNLCHRPSAFIH